MWPNSLLLARQLRRFGQSDAKFADLVDESIHDIISEAFNEADDQDAARDITTLRPHEDPYPPDWAIKGRSVKTAISTFRKLSKVPSQRPTSSSTTAAPLFETRPTAQQPITAPHTTEAPSHPAQPSTEKAVTPLPITPQRTEGAPPHTPPPIQPRTTLLPTPTHLIEGLRSLSFDTPRQTEPLDLNGRPRVGWLHNVNLSRRSLSFSSALGTLPEPPTPPPLERTTAPTATPELSRAPGNAMASNQPPDPGRRPPTPPAGPPATPLTLQEALQLFQAQAQQQNQTIAGIVAAAFQQQAPDPQQRQDNLRPTDVGIFDPDRPDPLHQGMVTDGKVTIYTDVYVFAARLTELAHDREQAVRRVWSQCLQGRALQWHTQILTDADRDLLRTASVDHVTAKLIDQFKPNYAQAMARWKRAKYTLDDVVAGRDITTFVQSCIRDAKVCGIEDNSRLLCLFEAFDGTIQSLIPKPTAHSTLDSFLSDIRERESTIRKLAYERSRAAQTQPRQLQVYQPQYLPNQQQYAPAMFARSDAPAYDNYRNTDSNTGFNGGNAGFRGRGYGRNTYNNFNNNYRGRYNPRGTNRRHQYQPYQQGYQQQQGARQGQSWQPAWQQPSGPTQQPGNSQPQPQRGNFQPRAQQDTRGNAYGRGYRAQWRDSRRNDNQVRAYHTDWEDTQELGTTDEEYQYDPSLDYDYSFEEPYMEDYEGAYIMPQGRILEELNFDNAAEGQQHSVNENETKAEGVQDAKNETLYNYHVTTVTRDTNRRCSLCDATFTSGNKLHSHLLIQHETTDAADALLAGTDKMKIGSLVNPTPHEPDKQDTQQSGITVESDALRICHSKADASYNVGTGYGFRSYTYLKMNITTAATRTSPRLDVCVDTGCAASLVDRTFLQHHFPGTDIRTRATPLTIRGIGTDHHTTRDFVVFEFKFPGTDSTGAPALACFRREMAVVDNLQANALVGNDILSPEEFDIMYGAKTAYIRTCGVTVPMTHQQHAEQVAARVTATQSTKLRPGQQTFITVTHEAPGGQDYIFEPHTPCATYAMLCDTTMRQIPVHNASVRDVIITKGQFVGTMNSVDPICQAFQTTTEEQDVGHEAPASYNPEAREQHLMDEETVRANTIKHPCGVTIYDGDPNETQALYNLISEYEDVFQDTGFANVPDDEHMRVHFKPDWTDNMPRRCRVYPQNAESSKFISDTVDTLMKDGKVFRTRHEVPFAFPVFVVWRNVPPRTEGGKPERKGRMVVDIRPLNKMVMTDAYPMRTQDDIIGATAGKGFITTLDAMSFYYQWRVHPQDQWAFTMVTADGQYTFNCPIMGYKNSNAYVQRKTDTILQGTVAKAYCDDIIAPSNDFTSHLIDLRQVLQVLRDANISIGPTKTFVGFPSTVVLGKLVDAYGLSTPEEKIAAIRDIEFPTTLKSLEHWIGLVTVLRHHVPNFSTLMEPLETRKKDLIAFHRPRQNNGKPRLGKTPKSARIAWAKAIPFNEASAAEKQAFEAVRDAVCANIRLAFHNPDRQLFGEFDAAATGIGVQFFHVRDDALHKVLVDDRVIYPPRTAIEPIAFISRTMLPAEKKYWATELELTGLVWTLKKGHHYITTSRKTPVILFTDHDSIVNMARQVDIANTTARTTGNKKIVRALEFVSQYDIKIVHKAGREHIVPDALSRLLSTKGHKPAEIKPDETPGQLDQLPWDRDECLAFLTLPPMRLELHDRDPIPLNTTPGHPAVSLVGMDPAFKAQLVNGYDEDPFWKEILKQVRRNLGLGHNRAALPFELRKNLLWRVSDDLPRLCVPQSCIADVFQTIHDGNHHGYGKLSHYLHHYYIRHGTKLFKQYLRTCPQCRTYQKPRHRPYGSLQPILTPPCPYHTISIDFVLGLPLTTMGNDCILVAVDKASKELLLTPGKTTFNAQTWGKLLLRSLLSANWGLPKVTISDRDPKFLSDMWKTMWRLLGTRLLHSTAYHPQTDGATERAIQTLEAALRIHIQKLKDTDTWEDTLPALQFEVNCTPAATGLAPLQVTKGFIPNNVTTLITEHEVPLEMDFIAARKDAADTLAEAAMAMKKHYDNRHRERFFEVGQRVYLRLHQGYHIPSAYSTKLGQQFAGPFRITDRVGRLAYRLDFPSHWKIHDVVSVAHLEPAILDPYGRQLPELQPATDNPLQPSRIADTRTHTTRSGKVVEKFLIEFEGLPRHYDRWLTRHELAKYPGAVDLLKT